jgi:hypothetical protein
MFVLLTGELQTMFLLPHFKGNSWCLMVPAMEGKKGVVPPFDLWKLTAEIRIGIRIFLFSFAFFFTADQQGFAS